MPIVYEKTNKLNKRKKDSTETLCVLDKPKRNKTNNPQQLFSEKSGSESEDSLISFYNNNIKTNQQNNKEITSVNSDSDSDKEKDKNVETIDIDVDVTTVENVEQQQSFDVFEQISKDYTEKLLGINKNIGTERLIVSGKIYKPQPLVVKCKKQIINNNCELKNGESYVGVNNNQFFHTSKNSAFSNYKKIGKNQNYCDLLQKFDQMQKTMENELYTEGLLQLQNSNQSLETKKLIDKSTQTNIDKNDLDFLEKAKTIQKSIQKFANITDKHIQTMLFFNNTEKGFYTNFTGYNWVNIQDNNNPEGKTAVLHHNFKIHSKKNTPTDIKDIEACMLTSSLTDTNNENLIKPFISVPTTNFEQNQVLKCWQKYTTNKENTKEETAIQKSIQQIQQAQTNACFSGNTQSQELSFYQKIDNELYLVINNSLFEKMLDINNISEKSLNLDIVFYDPNFKTIRNLQQPELYSKSLPDKTFEFELKNCDNIKSNSLIKLFAPINIAYCKEKSSILTLFDIHKMNLKILIEDCTSYSTNEQNKTQTVCFKVTGDYLHALNSSQNCTYAEKSFIRQIRCLNENGSLSNVEKLLFNVNNAIYYCKNIFLDKNNNAYFKNRIKSKNKKT